jgi:hypothetical protein
VEFLVLSVCPGFGLSKIEGRLLVGLLDLPLGVGDSIGVSSDLLRSAIGKGDEEMFPTVIGLLVASLESRSWPVISSAGREISGGSGTWDLSSKVDSEESLSINVSFTFLAWGLPSA